jgi:uncharacterized protein (DUF697 family)
MTDLNVPTVSLPAEIAALADRYRAANHTGIQLLNLVGGQADTLVDRLPDGVKAGRDEATHGALKVAYHTAHHSRGVVKDQRPWLNTAFATAMGAAGGVGGLPSALAELPVTTTVLMRAIQSVASEYGFESTSSETQRECLVVFAAAGPMTEDDDTDLGFITARLALTGATVQRAIGLVAPKLAVVLGQKLAAQAVPVIGAAAGAAVNYAFTSYYQQIAHVHFGLLALARRHGLPAEQVLQDFRKFVTNDAAN